MKTHLRTTKNISAAVKVTKDVIIVAIFFHLYISMQI